MLVNYGYLHQQFAEVDDYFEELQRWVPTGEFTLGPFVDKFEKKFNIPVCLVESVNQWR